jgi:hypothetical protein
MQNIGPEPEEERLLRIARRRREDNIKMDLIEIGWEDVGCIELAQDMNRWRTVVNFWFLDELSDCSLLKKDSASLS